MASSFKILLDQVLQLDESDRASLAGALIESLYGACDPEADETWNAVIERRIEELDSGCVKAVDCSEVRERLFRGYE